MSVIVLDKIDYYKIGKSLKLNFNFLNRLYEANQKAYDISYNLIQEIESLDQSDYFNINYDRYDQKTLNLKLRSIRYNIYPNNTDPIIDNLDLKNLDLVIYITDEKKEIEK